MWTIQMENTQECTEWVNWIKLYEHHLCIFKLEKIPVIFVKKKCLRVMMIVQARLLGTGDHGSS